MKIRFDDIISRELGESYKSHYSAIAYALLSEPKLYDDILLLIEKYHFGISARRKLGYDQNAVIDEKAVDMFIVEVVLNATQGKLLQTEHAEQIKQFSEIITVFNKELNNVLFNNSVDPKWTYLMKLYITNLEVIPYKNVTGLITAEMDPATKELLIRLKPGATQDDLKAVYEPIHDAWSKHVGFNVPKISKKVAERDAELTRYKLRYGRDKLLEKYESDTLNRETIDQATNRMINLRKDILSKT